MDGRARECGCKLTPMMPHDFTEGCLAPRAFTNSGSLPATPAGGFLPKKEPRLFCFSGVSGGYLRVPASQWEDAMLESILERTTQWGRARP